ncbi:MAG: phosphoribosylglycinamide formyltransferase [candidate division NC10 bacterium]|nr:phosphoribosylglycinamide formyltransferase [candidate division NC10 bacterium]
MYPSRKVKLGVLVSGRGSNLQAIIDASEAGRIDAEVVIVISDVADAYALERARKHKIDTAFVDPELYTMQKDFEKAVIDILEKYEVDLVCMAGFMRILSPYFINTYRNRIMNIHPALLPSFPGLHAQKRALNHGVKFSGCSVHFADEGTDTGPIIIQVVVPVFDDDTEETLAARILNYEHQIYPRAIQLFAEGRLEVRGRRVFCKKSEKERRDEKEGWVYINP